MFALAGSHRSGKTTLARAVADRMGVEFLETKVGDVFADLGLSPKDDLPFMRRLEVQNAILRAIEVQYQLRAGKVFIADRSPYDVMAYTMVDVRRDSIAPDERDLVAAHLQYARKIINDSLHGVLVVLPLHDQPEAEGKAQSCPFYMDHVHRMVCSLVESVTPTLKNGIVTGLSQTYDLDERIEDAVGFFSALRDIYDRGPTLWTPNS